MIKKLGVFGESDKRLPADLLAGQVIGLFVPPFNLGSMSSADAYRMFNLWSGRFGIATNGRLLDRPIKILDNYFELSEEPFIGDFVIYKGKREQINFLDVVKNENFGNWEGIFGVGKCQVNYEIPFDYHFFEEICSNLSINSTTLTNLVNNAMVAGLAGAANGGGPVLFPGLASVPALTATADGQLQAKVLLARAKKPKHGDIY